MTTARVQTVNLSVQTTCCEGESWTVSLEFKGRPNTGARCPECFLIRRIKGLAFERQYCSLAFAASALSVGCAGHATESSIVTVLQYKTVLVLPLQGSLFKDRCAPIFPWHVFLSCHDRSFLTFLAGGLIRGKAARPEHSRLSTIAVSELEIS